MTLTAISLILFALLFPLFGAMAVSDRRSKSDVYDSGSSKVAVLLSAADAQSIFSDPSATEGWYIPSYQLQTTIGPDRESEDVTDEAGTVIKSRTSQDLFTLTTTFMQSNDAIFALIEHLEDAANATRLRYPMPTNTDGEDQWVFGYNVNIRKENWSLDVQEGEDRQPQITFVFSKDSNGDIYDIVTLPDNQSDSAWDDYADFKDDASL
jgi:hypothetical protein